MRGRAVIKAINDAIFYLDGGAMNGIVPRPLWSKKSPPDDRGRIRLASRCLLFTDERSSRVFLVEAGIGNGWDEKKVDIYGIRKEHGGIVQGLREHGLSARDVTDVVLTHLHFDHCAGIVSWGRGGGVGLTFPDATIYVQKAQLEWALSPSIKDRGSYRTKDVKFIADSNNLKVIEGEVEISPSVRVKVLYGHTEAMQMVMIDAGGGEIVVVASDLVPIFSHVRIAWIMAYDNRPLVTVEEKMKFLSEASKAGWRVFSVHDPDIPFARIEQEGENRYRASPLDV